MFARSRLAREPVARFQELLVQLGLGRAGFGLPLVIPAHERGQAHEDRFRAPAALQAEERAAIPDEIELHVTTASIQLEAALALAERRIFPAGHDWPVRPQVGIAHRAGERETALK